MAQRAFEGRNSPVWFDVVDWFNAINTLMPEFESYLTPPKAWEELVADQDLRVFDSYDDFQDIYGSAGAFHDWHHLVEQESGFSQREINNTENIIRVPRGRHWQITSYMTTHREHLGGLSWRQWLRGKPIEEHRRVGMMAARHAGVLK